MLILLKSLLRTLILPPGGFLIIAIAGLVMSRWRPRLGRTLVGVGIASLWLCSMPVVADLLSSLHDRYPPLDLSHPTDAQAVVILGGGSVRIAPEYSGPAAESATLDRLNYGAFVARRTGLPVLVSGSPGEAVAMRTTLTRDFGITPKWVEGNSGDTFENARFSARLVRAEGIHRIILVTSFTHEWRAAHEFMAAGFDVVPAPVGGWVPRADGVSGFVPSTGGLTRSQNALYELVGEPVRKLFSTLHLRRQNPDG